MIIEPNIFFKVIMALFVVLLTEFIVNTMVYIVFSFQFPHQKYKTIRRKIIKHNVFERLRLLYLFEYGNFKRMIIPFILCWGYRIFAILLAVEIIFFKMPTAYSEYMLLAWDIMLLVPGVIYLKRFRD